MNLIRKSILLYLMMVGLVAINLVFVSDYPMSTYIIYIVIILVVLQLKESLFWGNKFKLGLKLGMVLISTVFVLEILTGWVKITGFDIDMSLILYSFALQVLVAFSEEISFRGYILKNFVDGMGLRSAVIINSVLFSALHIPSFLFYNLGQERIFLAFMVIALISTMISIIYLRYGLLSAAGFHFGWNFLQYHIFSLSSIQSGILNTSYTGPDWLTGGNYGPEAGILGLFVVIIALYILIVTTHKT